MTTFCVRVHFHKPRLSLINAHVYSVAGAFPTGMNIAKAIFYRTRALPVEVCAASMHQTVLCLGTLL